MSRERLDAWCERGIVGLVVVILLFGPLALGAVRATEFFVVQGLTALAMLLWLFRLWLNPRQHLLWPPACWGVLAFAGYALLRYWFADLEYVARQELARVLLYAVLFLVCVNNLYHQGSIRLVVYALVLLGTVQGCFAVYQYFTHLPHIWGVLRPERFLDRASGTYICPNHLAGLLEMILPLALAYAVAAKASALTRVFLGYGCFVMVGGLAFSMSRGGWMAAAFGLLLLLGLLAQTPRQWIALAVFVFLLVGIGLSIYSQSVALQLRVANLRKGLARLEHDTRYGQMVAAWKMWRDHPWFGVGPDHYDIRFRGYRAEHGLLQTRPIFVHNDYLNTLADWGALGTVLVALPLAMIAFGLARYWHRLRRIQRSPSRHTGGILPFLAGAVAGLGAILVHSTVDFNMHIPANAILAVVLLALLGCHLRFATDHYWKSLPLTGRLAASFLLLAGLAFFLAQGWRAAREDVWLRRAQTRAIRSAERLEALERASALEPGNAGTANLIGELHRLRSWQGRDNYEEEARQAMDWFQRAARLDPYDSTSRLGLAACLDWLDRHEDAEPWYRKALELDPNGCQTRAQMGWHYFLLGDYAAAVEWFNKVFKLDWEKSALARYYFPLALEKLEQQKREASQKK
jgi:O-antigen ligase